MKSTSKTTSPRQTKTPQQRAEEAVALATRRLVRATANQTRLTVDLANATAERDEATALLHYAQQHPALATPPTSTTNQEVGNA